MIVSKLSVCTYVTAATHAYGGHVLFGNLEAQPISNIQGVPENHTHFVFGFLCFMYSLNGPTTPFIWKLTKIGTQWVLKVFWQSNRTGDIFKSNLDFELLKKIRPWNEMDRIRPSWNLQKILQVIMWYSRRLLRFSLPSEPPETLLVPSQNFPALQNLKRHLGPWKKLPTLQYPPDPL